MFPYGMNMFNPYGPWGPPVPPACRDGSLDASRLGTYDTLSDAGSAGVLRPRPPRPHPAMARGAQFLPRSPLLMPQSAMARGDEYIQWSPPPIPHSEPRGPAPPLPQPKSPPLPQDGTASQATPVQKGSPPPLPQHGASSASPPSPLPSPPPMPRRPTQHHVARSSHARQPVESPDGDDSVTDVIFDEDTRAICRIHAPGSRVHIPHGAVPEDRRLGYGYYLFEDPEGIEKGTSDCDFIPVERPRYSGPVSKHHHSRHQPREQEQRHPNTFPYNPPPKKPSPPPPDRIDPNWKAWYDYLAGIDDDKLSFVQLGQILHHSIPPMYEYIKSIEGPQASLYKAKLEQLAAKLRESYVKA